VQSSSRNVAALPHLEESIVIVDEALGRIRDLSLELRPSLLDDLGWRRRYAGMSIVMVSALE